MATHAVGTTGATAGTFDTPAGHRIIWGAIFAGLALFFALGWLLTVLGGALGVGIADATDLGAMGDGLGVGAVIWMLVTSLLATFAGALLAAKLAGSPDDRIGALHGLTLWATATIGIVLLSAAGLGSMLSAAGSALSSSAQMSRDVLVGVSNSNSNSTDDLSVPDSIKTAVSAALKRQAARLVSATGGDSVSRSEARQAMNDLSAEDSGAIASALLAGEPDVAKERLARRTELSEREINSLVSGAERQVEQWQSAAEDAAAQAEQWLDRQMSSLRRDAAGALADLGGAQVSSSEVQRALRELDADDLGQAARYLASGEPELAKDVLAARTNLSEAEVDAIVDGAEQEAEERIDELQAKVNEVTETVGTYTQAALWAAFAASALGMVAGLYGGFLGAGTVRRIYRIDVATL